MKLYKAAAMLLLAVCGVASGQTSFWTTQVPTVPSDSDTNSVTLGLRFSSDVPGSVTGVRFYKGSTNTGTHTGQLWSSTGTKLAEVVFTNETTSGWQQALFSAPVAISANTTYVVSYLAPRGRYAGDVSYPWSNLSRAPLRVSGTSPGVYVYGSTPRFPTNSWNRSNYYVDVLFVPQGSSGTTYTISGRVSGSIATVRLSGAASKSATTDGSGNYSFTGLANGSYVVTPSQSGFTFTPASRSVSVSGASVSAVNFSASATTPTTPATYTISGRVSGTTATMTLSGTSGGTTVTDSAGNYVFAGLSNGSYVVAPSKSGYSFSPSSAPVSISGASVGGINFTGTAVVSRTVTLNWAASATPEVAGYHVYRSTTAGGPYTKVTASSVSATTYTDNNITAGRTYYYVATAVAGENESAYSGEATAVVPMQ